jgi:hypothetical protein
MTAQLATTNKHLARTNKSDTRAEVRCRNFTAFGRAAPTLNMNWHHPDLYFFLSLLTGLAALLAITYEIFSRRRKPPVILMKAMPPPDGLNESGPWSKPMIAVADLALPAYLKKVTPLDEFLLRDRSALTRLRNRFRRRFTPERNHNPWKKNYSPPWLSRYRLNKYSVIIGAFAILFVTSILNVSDVTPPRSIDATPPLGPITVVDGDTVRVNERKLADAATNRLRQLVASRQTAFKPVPCSCRPGTEGTQQCNYGRLCARLWADGRDVGEILISEGLARSYVCGQSGCPKRQSWCG